MEHSILLMTESDFVDVLNYEGLYQINKLGQLYSYKFKKLLKTSIDGKGYESVGLYKDGTRKNCRLHRLIALQFIPNPNNLPQIDHIDRNKVNNEISNLRWVNNTTNARNKDCISNRLGSIQILNKSKGEYYKAHFYYDYGKKITRSSYDRGVCEIFLEECRGKFSRNNE